MSPGSAALAGVVIDLVKLGVERQAVLARCTELEAKGATPAQIAQALVQWRDEVIDALAKKLA